VQKTIDFELGFRIHFKIEVNDRPLSYCLVARGVINYKLWT